MQCHALPPVSRAREVPGRRVGFIHVPATLARPGGESRGRSGACALTWQQAVDGGLEILAACLGRRAARITRNTSRPR